MMRFREEKGFTLIELMVVVLIIAILVAIAIPIFNRARESAWTSTCQANLRTIDGAIQTWLAGEGSYPAGFGSPAGEPLDDGHALIDPAGDGSTQGYLKRAPTCPKAAANGLAGSPPIADGSGNEAYSIMQTAAGPTAVAVYEAQCDNYTVDHAY